MIKTVSLDTAKLLKKNGLNLKKSLFMWVELNNGGCLWQEAVVFRNTFEVDINTVYKIIAPAPTTDEILELIPARLRCLDIDYWFFMSPLKENSAYDCRYKGWIETGHLAPWQKTKMWVQEPLLCEALAQMWLHLKREGYLNDK